MASLAARHDTPMKRSLNDVMAGCRQSPPSPTDYSDGAQFSLGYGGQARHKRLLGKKDHYPPKSHTQIGNKCPF